VLLYPDVQLDVEPRSVLFDASNYSERFPIMLRGRDDTVLEPMQVIDVFRRTTIVLPIFFETGQSRNLQWVFDGEN